MQKLAIDSLRKCIFTQKHDTEKCTSGAKNAVRKSDLEEHVGVGRRDPELRAEPAQAVVLEALGLGASRTRRLAEAQLAEEGRAVGEGVREGGVAWAVLRGPVDPGGAGRR